MTTYKDFKVKGFDVSKWNDNNETAYFPTFDKLIERGFRFVGIRTSVGVVVDEDFKRYWDQARGKIARIPYHYLDFYSYIWMKISPDEWGRRQAQFVWSLLKGDPGEAKKLTRKGSNLILVLDVENSSLAAITEANKSAVGRIINAFLLEFDRLSGSTTGIYTNLGYLFVFGNSHKTRPLWFSWYNRSVTIERIRTVLAAWQWTGEFVLLQYTSDGDVDDDGKSDAIALGMEGAWLDLNVAIAVTESDWTGVNSPTPEDNPTVIMPAVEYVTVLVGAGIKIHPEPSTSSAKIGAIAYQQKRIVREKKSDLNLDWVRIDEGWICVKYGSQVLAEVK